jgi:hypothetical protein
MLFVEAGGEALRRGAGAGAHDVTALDEKQEAGQIVLSRT